MDMIFHSHANKTYFHKKGCALGLILKVRDFETRKWPIVNDQCCTVELLYKRPPWGQKKVAVVERF